MRAVFGVYTAANGVAVKSALSRGASSQFLELHSGERRRGKVGPEPRCEQFLELHSGERRRGKVGPEPRCEQFLELHSGERRRGKVGPEPRCEQFLELHSGERRRGKVGPEPRCEQFLELHSGERRRGKVGPEPRCEQFLELHSGERRRGKVGPEPRYEQFLELHSDERRRGKVGPEPRCEQFLELHSGERRRGKVGPEPRCEQVWSYTAADCSRGVGLEPRCERRAGLELHSSKLHGRRSLAGARVGLGSRCVPHNRLQLHGTSAILPPGVMFPLDPKDADWDHVHFLKATLSPAPAREECVFPTCGVQHSNRGLACGTCGGRTTKSCIREHLPAGVVPDALRFAGDPQWRCPVCSWGQGRPAEPAAPAPDHHDPDLQPEEDPLSEDSSEPEQRPAEPGAPRDPFDDLPGWGKQVVTELRKSRVSNRALRKRVEALEKEVAGLRMTLPGDFCVHAVSTWGPLTEPNTRALVRVECGKAFREHALPINMQNAKEWQVETKRLLGLVTDTLELFGDTPPRPAALKILHDAVVELTGITQLGKEGAGPHYRREYVARAKSYAVSDFTPHVMERLLRELVARVEKETKGHHPKDRRRSLFSSGDRNDRRRERDYDRGQQDFRGRSDARKHPPPPPAKRDRQ